MDNFLYSINATLPIFLMIILGKFLSRIHLIDGHFIKTADKYVFTVALPALIFRDLTENDIRQNFDGGYVLFCFLVTLVSILAIWGLTEIFMKKEEERGAFIQASYRSSAAILGLAFINNMYNGAGMAPLMIIGAVPLFNIFAVIILTLKGGRDNPDSSLSEDTALAHTFGKTILDVFKNPILLSILIALPFAFLNLHFPVFVDKTISSIGNTATPLALISIGAGFEGRKAIKKIKPTIVASFIKLILLAALFLPLAIYLGYRNQELMAILIMLASPTTVACYIMAKNTGNDSTLTSSIIVLTTLLSSITLTLWIFLLRSFGVL
ncbi:MAG: AEC family transporter [Lachnospiraceae bacterium]|nr:AEC family transporter [Lachnospiraceae bacterium]